MPLIDISHHLPEHQLEEDFTEIPRTHPTEPTPDRDNNPDDPGDDGPGDDPWEGPVDSDDEDTGNKQGDGSLN